MRFAVMLGLAACVLSGSQPALGSLPGDAIGGNNFAAGFSVLVYGNPADFIESTNQLLDRLRTLHVTSVSLVFPLFQDDWTSSSIHADAKQTLTVDKIAAFVKAAHRRQMTVMIRPILDEATFHKDGKWRGSIEPADSAAWFRSYADLMTTYATVARETGAEAFDIGSEFSSLQQDRQGWASVIQAVRNVYQGHVGYSLNWDDLTLGFSDLLDFVGVDAFFPLDVPDGASVDTLAAAWQPWLAQVEQLGQATGKPIVLTEVGTAAQAGSYRAPWVWPSANLPSQDDQATYFAALCQTLAGQADGMYVWMVDPNQSLKAGATDDSFNPLGKRAEHIIAACYAARTGGAQQ